MSSLLKDTGDLEGAEDAARRALTATESMPPRSGAERRLAALNRLAAIHGYRGDWPAYVDANNKLLSQRRALYGEQSVRLAVDYHNVATGLQAIGNYVDAAVHQRRAEELLIAAGESESVKMGFVLQGLAIIETETGNYPAAREAIERARVLLLASLPADHQRLQALEVWEATLAARVGDIDGAMSSLQDILARGDLRPISRYQAKRSLAEILAEAERWQEAADMFEQLLMGSIGRYQFYFPLAEAGRAYSAYRAGADVANPAPVIEDALRTLRRDGYANLPMCRTLEVWLEQLPVTQHAAAAPEV